MAAALLFSFTRPAGAADLSKLSPDLAAALPAAKQSTSARTAAPASPAAEPTLRVLVRSRQPLIASVRTRLGQNASRVGRTFEALGTVVMEVTPSQLAKLSEDPAIATISPDRRVDAANLNLDINPRSVGADIAWAAQRRAGVDGSGIGVAVVDSGIHPAPDLARRIVAFKDFVNGRTAPYDDFGHGTHVAGIVAGGGQSSSGPNAAVTFAGIAPGAHLIGVKVLGADGSGNVSDVINGIEWCIENRKRLNIRILNLSLGHAVSESYRTDPLCQAVDRAVQSGIVVVVSAGNRGGGYGGVGTPGNTPSAITVGASNTKNTAVRSDDVITTYTGRGPTRYDYGMKPDLIAPGNKIASVRAPGSTIDLEHPQWRVATGEYLRNGTRAETAYTRLSGTSMATPAVAGAAAIALQANRALTPYAVKAALMVTAQMLQGTDPITQYVGPYDPLTQGAGQLNIPGLVEMAYLLRPHVGLTGAPSLASTISGETFPWWWATVRSENLVWGDRNLVWGDRNLVWGDSVIWGDRNLVWGDRNLVWGDRNLVWGDNLIWGDRNLVWGDGSTGISRNLVWGDRNLVWGDNLIWGDRNLVWGDSSTGIARNLVWGD